MRTNADCVQKVLDILIGNAVRYTGENGIIELSIADNLHHIVLCVSDNGDGILPKDIKYIFDRFYRGGNSYVKGGNGLGLAIAKELADALGEKIWVESAPGHGSRFYLTVKK